jgi:hypothetical protein
MADQIEINLMNLRTLGQYKPELVDIYDEDKKEIIDPLTLERKPEQVSVDELQSKKMAAEVKPTDPDTRLIDLYDEEKQKIKSPLELSVDDNGNVIQTPVEGKKISTDDLKNRDNQLPSSLYTFNPLNKIEENILYKSDANPSGGIDAIGSELTSASPFPGQTSRLVDIKKGDLVTKQNVTMSAIEDRKRNLTSELNIFLYNLFPYIGTGVARSISGALTGQTKVGTNPIALANMAGTVLNALNMLSYLSADELVLLFGSNFYTMFFARGISVKKKALSILSEKLEAGTDINFGESTNQSWGAQLQNFVDKSVNSLAKQLLGITDSKPDPNYEGAAIKQTKSPEITFRDDGFSVNSISSTKPALDPSNVKYEKRYPSQVDYPSNTTPERAIEIGVTRKPRSIKAANKEKNFFKKNGIYQVGAIYVMPIFDTDNKNGENNFYIPFEFNPQIEEGSITTKYQAQEFLARIGQTQTFIGVDSLTVTINARYWAVSHDVNPVSDDLTWMSEFTMNRIQAI